MTWPEESASLDLHGQVDTDGWWSHLERLAIEAAVFKDTKLDPFVATDIAPWIPPACRSVVVFNTEFQKKSSKTTKPIGCPKKLSELISNGQYSPLESQSLSVEMLRKLCQNCDIPSQTLSKVGYN